MRRSPNDLWCVDFKGWFRTGDGARCEPLTLIDAASRYLLRCQVLERTDGDHVWPVLDAAFREFGLPRALRSDNGSPFASIGAGGLSKLSIKLVKAGVTPERIVPGKPQQNGRLERFHLTLLEDTADPPASALQHQIAQFAAFRRTYNEERPHAALDNHAPDEIYDVSPRRFDGVLRDRAYGSDHEVRRVRSNGEINGRAGHLRQPGARRRTGRPDRGRQGWRASYGPVHSASSTLHERLRKPDRRTRGRVDNPAG